MTTIPECSCVVVMKEEWDSPDDGPTVVMSRCNLCRSAPALLEALEAVERITLGVGEAFCPKCFSVVGFEHTSDCKLAAAIKAARREG